MSYEVIVTAGPDKGRSLRSEHTLLIGTASGADLRLTDSTVAERHVALTPRGNDIHVRSLGNANGTWVKTIRLNDLVLTESTELTIGRTTLLVSVSPDLRGGASLETIGEDLSHLPYREARARALEQFERAYLKSVLARTDNVVVRAARHAVVARVSFHRMLSRNRANAADVGQRA